MSTIPQRIASAFTILFGQHGDVTEMARDRDRSRQALYREAEQVLDAVDGTAARDRVNALEQQVARLQAQVHDLRARLERSVEMTPEKRVPRPQARVHAPRARLERPVGMPREKPAGGACVARAGGVSLPVARRPLQVLLPPKPRGVPTLGRATAAAGRHAGQLLEVL